MYFIFVYGYIHYVYFMENKFIFSDKTIIYVVTDNIVHVSIINDPYNWIIILTPLETRRKVISYEIP